MYIRCQLTCFSSPSVNLRQSCVRFHLIVVARKPVPSQSLQYSTPKPTPSPNFQNPSLLYSSQFPASVRTSGYSPPNCCNLCLVSIGLCFLLLGHEQQCAVKLNRFAANTEPNIASNHDFSSCRTISTDAVHY